MLLYSHPNVHARASRRYSRCRCTAEKPICSARSYKCEAEQLPGTPAAAVGAAAHKHAQLLADWASRATAVAAASVMTASAVLMPPMVLPAAAEMGMDAGMAAEMAKPGTASSRFQCTPLTDEQRAQYFDLKGFHHPIHTSSPLAQQFFDQGLLMAYNFNHPEALRSFQAGLRQDPAAAMLHWGVTYALSPYANVVWGAAPPDQSYPVVTPKELLMAQQAAKDGLAAAASALAAAPDDPQLQAELQYAQAAHQLWEPIRNSADPAFTPALKKYAEALEAIASSHPSDADAPALAAEARMNLSPWEHWQGPLERRRPVKAQTVVLPALADISTALQRQSGHPLAAHLFIHLTEAGTPGAAGDVPAEPGYAVLGEVGADLLAAGPAYPQMGHLTHMPSHTYLRTGRWHKAVLANKQALMADEAQAAKCVEPYMPQHNASLLQFAAANAGEFSEAEALAQRQVHYPELFGPTNMSDGRERSTLPMLYARFAQWDQLLALQPSQLDYSSDGVMTPPGTQQYNQGVWHYTRALALAAAATREQDSAARAALVSQVSAEVSGLASAVAATPADPITRPGDGIGIYSPGFKRLGQIELLTAQARLDVLNSNLAAAASHLRKALQVDNSFGYTEPPRQSHPLKPCLGWILLQQGKLDEAEKVYLDDLAMFPRNPWALKGLQQVYSRQHTQQAADKLQQVEARLAAAWSHADKGLPLNSSCPAFSD